jgi:4-hydroxy-4-methyl-2-oxoglutarate aldolase
MNNSALWRELAELGVATLYEAAGRSGLIDLPLIQVIPGSRAAGPARTAVCGQDDNLMAHAVIEHIQPGEVLVLAMPEASPVALVGELLATQVKARGAAALLVDAAVRDVEGLASLDLPVWARYVRVRGASKSEIGALNVPVRVGGTSIRPGDAIVLDSDGAVCLGRERLEEVAGQARARRDRETELRARLQAGEMSFDIHGLRAFVKEHSP